MATTNGNRVRIRIGIPGGHFAACEQPDLFVQEMRTAFKSLRSDEAKTASAEHN
jgi:hypothetical protein